MSRKNKAGTRWLALLLAISLGSTPAGTTVFAASDLSANAQEGKVTDTSQNFEVEGNDSVGDALASAISEETQESENRKQSDPRTSWKCQNRLPCKQCQSSAQHQCYRKR